LNDNQLGRHWRLIRADDGDHIMKPNSNECYCGETKKVEFRKYL